MATIFFKSHEIVIHRPRPKGTDRWAYSATFTAYSADIQPVPAERVQLYDGRIGKTFIGFVDDTIDVKESDQVVAENVNGRMRRYSVKAVSTYHGAGLLDYKELILMAMDDDR